MDSGVRIMLQWNCGLHDLYLVTAILIILMGRDKPGLPAAPKLLLSAVLGVVLATQHGPWPTHVTQCIGLGCRVSRIALHSDFFWHFLVTITWQMDKIVYTLPCQDYSLSFCHKIEPPKLLNYRDIIPFIRWWNFNTKVRSFLLAIGHVCTYVVVVV